MTGKRRYYAALDRFRRHYLRAAMKAANHNVRAAAELAGLGRTEFYRLLNRFAPELAPKKKLRLGNARWNALEDHRVGL